MKVGDTVKLKPAMWQGIKPESYGLSFTGEYKVTRVFTELTYPSIQVEGSAAVWDAGAFQVVVKEKEKGVWESSCRECKYLDFPCGKHKEKDALVKEQSIERPVLEERKKDKIRMELVDQGFPLALLELAKVMTWANNNKGYKDHDWKNIPDAENAFKGAAARHRVKFDAQRGFGNEMLDCTDEESGIIHLAHECFNNLALLELALAGKVK